MRSSWRGGAGRTAVTIAVGVVVLGGTSAQAAPDGTLVAHYESASSEHSCTTSGDCSSGANVDGSMSVDARAYASSAGGSASAGAWASSTVVAAQELTGSVPAMKYILHYELSEAYANTGNRFWDENYGDWGDLGAQYWLTLSAEHSACESCSISEFVVWSAYRYWWDDTGQYSTWAPTKTWFPVTMRNRAGGSVPAGTVRFTVRLQATADATVYRSGGVRTHPECVYPGGEGCSWADTQSWAEARARAVGRLTGIDHEILGVKPLTQPPTARFSVACSASDWYPSGPTWCSFDARASSDPDDEIVEYNWEFGDGARSVTPPDPRANHRYSSGTSSYVATLTVVDHSGASDSESITVTPWKPNEPPTATFTFSCSGSDCVFDSSSSSDPEGGTLRTYFEFGDGSWSGWGPPGLYQHRYADATKTYVVKLTVEDARYGYDTFSKNVTPQPPNQVPTARFTVSCTKTDCRLDAGGSSDPDGQITAYAWDFGDGTGSSGPSVQHRYAEGAGSYVVSLTVTDERGGTDAESRTVKCTRKNQNKPTTCT